ncbi:MAG: hypothetical protein JHC84_03660 [Solirubrobacteraceae bacterium]|nr:hypothetical protein [Solirubrobacteraceae bacterium]
MTSQDRTVIMLVLCVVLAGAGWFLAIKPKRAEVAEVTTQVEVAQQAADQAAASAATARAAKAAYRDDYSTVTRLGKAVPVDDDVASLVYQLETTAEGTDINFESVTVAEGVAPVAAAPAEGTDGAEGEDGAAEGAEAETAAGTLPGQVTEVPITLTFDGGYFDMTRFLRKIDRYTLIRGNDEIDVRGRLLAVNSVKLSPGSKGFPDVQAEVTVSAYRAPLPEVDGQGATAAAGATPAATGATPASTTAGGDAQ